MKNSNDDNESDRDEGHDNSEEEVTPVVAEGKTDQVEGFFYKAVKVVFIEKSPLDSREEMMGKMVHNDTFKHREGSSSDSYFKIRDYFFVSSSKNLPRFFISKIDQGTLSKIRNEGLQVDGELVQAKYLGWPSNSLFP